MKKLMLGFLAIGLVACAEKDGNDRLKEKAKIEQEQQSDVERKKLQERAQKMEVDLANRHYFYNSLEGEFEGSLTVKDETYKIRFVFARSIPPYTGERIRELSEIENDINNLFFHMQVVQWHPADNSSAVGCRVTGIRPNMDLGSFVVASNDCPNLYSLFISNVKQSLQNRSKIAIDYAERVRRREIKTVDNLVGFVQPSSISTKYPFAVKRIN